MAIYAVNENGVNALRELARHIYGSSEHLRIACDDVETAMDDYPDTLGPHASELAKAIEFLRITIIESSKPCDEISSLLLELAEDYEDIIENDRLKSQNGAETKGKGIIGRTLGAVFGKSSRSFGSFEADKHGFIKGSAYESFIADWECHNPDDYNKSSFHDEPIYETISPSLIEGLHLNDDEINDPGRFWSMHEKNGTKDSFGEIASHIPQVKAELEAGRSIDSLIEDPVLGNCANIYFNPANMTEVKMCDGYYEFISNGRHRILAARELGLDIPVKIVESRRRK